MAQECPTGILLDLSEPTELSPEPASLSIICSNSDPVGTKQLGDYATDKDQCESSSKEKESANVSNESDCDFIENETLNDLSACSTQSSSNSGDEVRPIIWSPETSKKTHRRVIKKDLSIGQRVEVFKEATSIAMHLENLSRGTPPPKPLKNLFTSPLLERSLHNNLASNSNKNSGRYFDLDMCSKALAGTENKRPKSETGNPISFRPPVFAKPEARVQPILKSKIKENELETSGTLSLTLRMNKMKAMTGMTSSSRQSGPIKAKIGSPMKHSVIQQRVIGRRSLNPANSKTPLPNYKPVSSTCTPLNDISTIGKHVATVTRSSSFGAESSRIRRQSTALSASFSVRKPSIRSQTPDKKLFQSQSSQANSKPVGRRSVGGVYLTPVQPLTSELCRSTVESSTVKRLVIPTLHSTPHKAPFLTPLIRGSSTSGNIAKKKLVSSKGRFSTSCNSPKTALLPNAKLEAVHLRSSVPKT